MPKNTVGCNLPLCYNGTCQSNENNRVGAWLSCTTRLFLALRRLSGSPHYLRDAFLHYLAGRGTNRSEDTRGGARHSQEDDEMAWIEVHQSLMTHRKTMELSDDLGIEPVHAVGHLVTLWAWSLDNAPDGVLPNSGRIIARAAHWNGDAPTFVCALINAGFIDICNEGRHHIHGWMDYAGRLIERRQADAKRKRVQRKSAGHLSDGVCTQPNPTAPNTFRTNLNGKLENSNARFEDMAAMRADGRASRGQH